MNITTDDWAEAFKEATTPRPGDTGNKTVEELSELMGIDARVVRIRLKKLDKQKRIIICWEKRPSIDGLLRLRPAYRLKEGEEKK